MKWPWTRPPENRGTITLLQDGQFILGMPHGASQEQTYAVHEGLREWLDSGATKTLVVPFPVDIVDRRPETPRLALGWGLHGLQQPLDSIALSLRHLDQKTVKRRPRVILCQHPELHPGEQIG